MIKYWYKQFPQYPPDHLDYWRIRLIEHSLLITTSYFLILSLLNLFYFESYKYALLDGFGLLVTLGIYCHFRKTGQVKTTSWAVTIMVASLIMLFLITAKGYAHSLFWATLIPPFSFFLIGRTWGTVVSSITFTMCALLVYQQIQHAEPVTFTMGSLFNVIEVCIAQVLIFRFYEKTRFSAYQKLALRNIEIQKMAETDKLTGLYNRDKLDVILDKLLTTPEVNSTQITPSLSGENKQSSLVVANQYSIDSTPQNNDTSSHLPKSTQHIQYPISVAIIDIDHFKRVNDNHGHLVGDKVLCELAQLLQSQMRSNDLLARWGGEEFVVILPNTTLDDAMELNERLRQFIASNNIQGMELTISLGVAQYELKDTVHSLLDRADKALYEAKSAGRNRVVVA
ncbi:GGDEF domain-containing protein [Shewanella glacialimarina]|jgi:diguanylate cyclase (GGDEF)-like protein|uniref:GGDEF domain-containing protein n=1 Tax=Shewanella glacialimarina TaxID=2590884 RepID=UPI001CF851B7|nr:GGDEF domain-containing protein [Shewanella glacialimarina]UCX06170.1 GGDEF domain-containing protein [Shewanella glacialimarina]